MLGGSLIFTIISLYVIVCLVYSSPITEKNLLAAHGNFLRDHVTPEALDKIIAGIPALLDSVPVLRVDNLLRPVFYRELDAVEFNSNGRAVDKSRKLPLLVTGLLPFMRDMSRLHAPASNHLDRPTQSIRRLRYTPANKPTHTLIGPHRDFGNGHSVLYNRNVVGPQVYRVGDVAFPLQDNQLTVLNSGAEYSPERGVWGTALHSVEADPCINDEVLEGLVRDRYLAYYEGFQG